MGGFDQEQQRRRSGESGNEDYAVRSGVQLVLPTPEELAHQSPRTLEGTDANTTITVNRQSFSKRKASIASTSSVGQDPQTHADAPKIKRPRFKGSYKHASSAGDFTSDESVAVLNQEVPVWDINTSAGRWSEGEEGGSARLSIGKDGYTDLEGHHGGDVSDDQENGYYVSSNMLLHDLVSSPVPGLRMLIAHVPLHLVWNSIFRDGRDGHLRINRTKNTSKWVTRRIISSNTYNPQTPPRQHRQRLVYPSRRQARLLAQTVRTGTTLHCSSRGIQAQT